MGSAADPQLASHFNRSIIMNTNTPELKIVARTQLFRVRVCGHGVAPYAYTARAHDSMDLWLTTFERATANLKEDDLPPKIAITAIGLKGVKA